MSIKIFLTIAMLLKLTLGDELIVTTKYGQIFGSYEESTGNRVFLGIPYASPPTGSLRFKPPQPPASWAPTILKALQFGPWCLQKLDTSKKASAAAKLSEDCLYLNIWTPPNVSGPLPVMVWINGSFFKLGTSSDPIFSGNNISKQGNVIVVTLNYRLGAFGFFASESLSKEDPNWPTSGNYGLLDQNMALQWVRENIGAFGGDPENVTLFGQSAGSFSICYHILMPKSKGLFKRAILQSGSCSYPVEVKGKQTNNIAVHQDFQSTLQEHLKFMKDLGCSDISCVRNRSDGEIKYFQDSFSFKFWPSIDGVVIPGDPLTLFKNGSYNKVDILIGTTLDDGSIYSLSYSYKQFESYIEVLFPNHYKRVLEIYPESTYKTGLKAFSQMWTDNYFVCPGRSLLNSLTANNGTAYQYVFAYPPSYMTEDDRLRYGAYHGAENTFVFNYPFDNNFNLNKQPFTKDELVLSSQMIDLWTSFAKTGIPSSSSSLINWDKFNNVDQSYIKLNIKELKIEKNLSKAMCDIYDEILNTSGTSFLQPLISMTLLMILIIFS
jgi:para-nitrobenzyl esterase